jgi:prophage regulatory protein
MSLETYRSIKYVSGKKNLSKASIYRMVAAGTFPAPVKLSPGRVGWRDSDLERWDQTRPLAGKREAA